MIRIAGLALLAAIVGLAAYVYDVKYQTGRLTRQAAETQRQIERERDSIAALRAEQSRLEQPSRIQQLAERHLRHLRPFTVAQLGVPHEMPDRPVDLGVFLQSLGSRIGPEVGTPTGAARSPIRMPAPVPQPAQRRR